MSVQLASRLIPSMIMLIENMNLYVDNKLLFNVLYSELHHTTENHNA